MGSTPEMSPLVLDPGVGVVVDPADGFPLPETTAPTQPLRRRRGRLGTWIPPRLSRRAAQQCQGQLRA